MCGIETTAEEYLELDVEPGNERHFQYIWSKRDVCAMKLVKCLF